MEWYRNSHYSMPDYKIVGYVENHESYVETTEQVVRFHHVPGLITDFKHSPPRKDLYKDHRIDDKPKISFSVPWGSPKKVDRGFSPPKFRDEGFHGKSHYGYRDNHPPSIGDYNSPRHDYGKHNSHLYQTVDHYTDDDDDYVCEDGVCIKNTKGWEKPKYLHQEDDDSDDDDHHNYDYHNENKKGNGFAPHTYTPSPIHQPRKDTYYGKPLIDANKNHEKHKENNGYAPHSNHSGPVTTQPRTKEAHYRAPNTFNQDYIVPPSTQPIKEPYYEAPNALNYTKQKGNDGYAPHSNFTLPVTTQPRTKETYDEPPKTNHEKNKGNGFLLPSSSYKVPETIQPKKEPHSDNSPRFAGPPPIKTRRDVDFPNESGRNSPLAPSNKGNGYLLPTSSHKVPETIQPKKETHSDNSPRFGGPPIKTRRDAEFSNESWRNSPLAPQPQLYGSPRKDDQGYKETIDSAEAKRRYRGASVPQPAQEQKYTRTINCIEAAIKYKGVFVPYN